MKTLRIPSEIPLWTLLHRVPVVMDPFTRRIIGFGVHAADVDGVALCRMFNTAISTKGSPKYLSADQANSNNFRWLAH